MKTNETTPIPQGYKATLLGIIPQEWEVKRLGDIAQCFSGGTPKARNNEYYGGNIPFIRSGEIHQKDTELFLSEMGIEESSAKMVQKGDLLMALYGANSGDSAVSQIDGAINQAILCIRPRKLLVSFLCPYLELNKDMYISKYLQGGQGNLSGEIVLNYKIPVPPLAEQKKIAEVLGVWDKAIEKQSQLIEQLTLRKRGLMQQLLTAKRRLPGFSEPWRELKIRDIAKIRKGEQVNKEDLFSNAKYPVINGGITPSGYLDIYNTTANTITISEGGNSCGYVNFMTTPFWSGGHCYTIDVKDGINNLFVYQLLKHNEKYIMSLRVGSGLPNIQVKDLENLKLAVPNNQEQTAIAQVLTAADREVELAQQKLELLRQQKRGLMQQLLTGKKRVKY